MSSIGAIGPSMVSGRIKMELFSLVSTPATLISSVFSMIVAWMWFLMLSRASIPVYLHTVRQVVAKAIQ